MVLADSKNRMSLDVIGQLQEVVEAQPWNYSLWSKLIDQVVAKDKEEQVRATFDKYLSIFKFDAKQWSNYINFELNRGDFSKVEKLFARCLPITTDVDICRTYVLYVRRVNDVITGGEKARSTVVLSFDFAVNKVGVDLESYDLWKDYLEFFKSWTPSSSWEQQQKNDLIRKLYRRCLVIPTSKIETIWSEYTKWENDVSTPNSASKFIADLSTSYMEARSWNTEWHNVTKNSLRRKLIPSSPTTDTANIIEDQISLWYLWIDLEKKNSLKLQPENLQTRIEYVFKRATSLLPFVPELWFRNVQFLLQLNEDANRDTCIELLNDSLILNPESYLLTFQLAELLERENAFSKAQQLYENLIKRLSDKHALVQEEIDNIKRKSSTKKGSKPAAKEFSEAKPASDDEEEEEYQPVIQYKEADALAILKLEDKLQELSNSVTLVYVKLMGLCKRSQGIKEVRSVFKQRKNFKSMGYELYVENALIEFYSDNKKTADKIFDLAMKSFGQNGAFLYRYLDYLILTNGIESLKVFFEVAVTNLLKKIENDKEALQVATINILDQRNKLQTLKENEHFMKKIIRRYIDFAARFLELNTVLNLEKRFIQYFPESDQMALFADRYKMEQLDVVARYDLGDKNAFTSNTGNDEEGDTEEMQPNKRRKTKSRDNYSPESAGSGKASTHINRLLASSQRNGQAPHLHGFVGNQIYGLLQHLPNAGYFGPPPEHVFDSGKLVQLFANVELPGEE
ncbi:hypothetical protein METBIDRAFT_33849 [Metschnikowia bicuspidata var. bicuspidata NRRL YB-4993]|uniref:mRNA 3'-end-processing protein RNA14 n=1 Tax=Metschnikowia bicuspidata var. bicuspidata NRRL YB-4993 TaxID=869754 RepID=A0A1A0GZ98_9ASCO|nr:hypothetical protein METBIDRAFT_33849 [Metschnikowia bicuspidata var. bicuspidata NRRL YB-4993]OBA17022.1 hypothetical protein METBIDRAFT_33849 [Metschnikowia bicuspidata var. bicuspidata NRRL YB-4993]